MNRTIYLKKKKQCKNIVLNEVSSAPYSPFNLEKRRLFLEELGYLEKMQGNSPANFDQYSQHVKKKRDEVDVFFDWYNDCALKKCKEKVGRVAWLGEHLAEMKRGTYPKRRMEKMGLHPYKDKTPINYINMLQIMRYGIGNELVGSTYLIKGVYVPTTPDLDRHLYALRKDAIARMGSVVHFMGRGASQWIHCWLYGLYDARVGMNKQKKLFENPKFFGSLFPIGYRENPTGHPRLKYRNYNNISTMVKPWRISSINRVEECTGMFFYTADMSNCHARVFYWVGKNLVQLKESDGIFLQDNIWDQLANSFLRLTQLEKKLSFNAVRKIFKIGFLALMNGGGLSTDKNIRQSLEDFTDSDGQPYTCYSDVFMKYIANIPASKEIVKTCKKLANNGVVYPLGGKGWYVQREEPHKALSAIYCCVELLCLTHMVQTALLPGIDLVPVAAENDGIVFMVDRELAQGEISNFELAFEGVLSNVIGVPFEVKIKAIVKSGN